MFFSRRAGHRFVDRGNPSTWDWNDEDITFDDDYHILDLSDVVPPNAVAVIMQISCKSDISDNYISMRHPSHTNDLNIACVRTKEANTVTAIQVIVYLGGTPEIEIAASAGNWVYIRCAIMGWLI